MTLSNEVFSSAHIKTFMKHSKKHGLRYSDISCFFLSWDAERQSQIYL